MNISDISRLVCLLPKPHGSFRSFSIKPLYLVRSLWDPGLLRAYQILLHHASLASAMSLLSYHLFNLIDEALHVNRFVSNNRVLLINSFNF